MENVDYVVFRKRRDEMIWGVKVYDVGNYLVNVSKLVVRIGRRLNCLLKSLFGCFFKS